MHPSFPAKSTLCRPRAFQLHICLYNPGPIVHVPDLLVRACVGRCLLGGGGVVLARVLGGCDGGVVGGRAIRCGRIIVREELSIALNGAGDGVAGRVGNAA